MNWGWGPTTEQQRWGMSFQSGDLRGRNQFSWLWASTSNANIEDFTLLWSQLSRWCPVFYQGAPGFPTTEQKPHSTSHASLVNSIARKAQSPSYLGWIPNFHVLSQSQVRRDNMISLFCSGRTLHLDGYLGPSSGTSQHSNQEVKHIFCKSPWRTGPWPQAVATEMCIFINQDSQASYIS